MDAEYASYYTRVVNNEDGQQGNGGNEDLAKITKIKTFEKEIKNIVTCGAGYGVAAAYRSFHGKPDKYFSWVYQTT